ncbi:SDR family NAD(P)-dependent oxidoreductase [Micromonospora sp. DT231]|uniref:type I polyketide synthase n=1 Tax=Micromonospora sp. DT231 TaxID=3416526 RepID=UPI003CFB4FCA
MADNGDDGLGIAIVGMAGRLPGAETLDAFWAALVAGEEGLTRWTPDQLADAGVPAETRDDPAYVPVVGALRRPARFDAEFFGYTPAEAELTDPQQRMLLETAWHALEDAGYAPQQLTGRVGVFASGSTSGYRSQRIDADPERRRTTLPVQAAVSTDLDMLALRVAYKLDLRGPAVTVQTACSSSLVAVHLAAQSLLLRECDVALAGGAAVRLLDAQGYHYDEGGILSPDGHCRPFDAAAAGTVVGDGTAVVALKRLDDAQRDGDHVYAVIRGSAVNNDGAEKAGFTAPSPRGQAEVIAEALAVAGVDPATVRYVEAHGTGTPLGDPIEVRALTEVFGPVAAPGSCLLGSVKGNVGHLDTAAGVVGLIKAALAIAHRYLPPTLHYRSANPATGLDGSPFRVSATGEPWPRTPDPARAGVSSFGIGGTNVHVVLEAPPASAARGLPEQTGQVLPVSARTPAALDAACARLADRLAADAGLHLPDVAYTLQSGRVEFPFRRAVTGTDAADVIAALRATRTATRSEPAAAVFLLPGQGSQYPGAGARLYDSEPEFRAAFDECAKGFGSRLGIDLHAVAFADDDTAAERLRQTVHTQPVLFSLDYAVARTLLAAGIRPAALLGHSLGELVAACLAGVFTLDDAITVVAARARLMNQAAPGRMLTVAAPAETVEKLLDGDGNAVVAAVNSPRSCVVAGTPDEIAEAERRLTEHGLRPKRLATSHAFHTALVEPALPEFGDVLRGIPLAAPRIPFVSNVTGTWITDEQATDPHYWVGHVRQPVRFSDGVRTVLGRGVLVEAGPGSALTTLAGAHGSDDAPVAAVALLRHRQGSPTDEVKSFRDGVAELWSRGVPVDWAAWHRTAGRRVSLPGYPFEGDDHLLPRPGEQSPTGRLDPARWTSVPVWRRAPRPAPAPTGPRSWLVLPDHAGLAASLVPLLEARGDTVRIADDGLPAGRFDHVVDARGIGGDPGLPALFDVARSLGASGDSRPVRIDVLTDELHDVDGTGAHGPQRATVLGAARVLAQEFDAIRTRCVDVRRSDTGLAEHLVAELSADSPDEVVALRGGRRWLPAYAGIDLGPAPADQVWNRDATYLVTGATHEPGLSFAEDMIGQGARVMLAGPPGFPALDEWATTELPAQTRDRLVRLAESGRIGFVAADLASREDVRRVVDAARDHLGTVDGVVHAVDVRGSGLIALKTAEQIDTVLNARVRSTLLLDELLPGDLDFFLTVSSTTGLVGGIGQAENAAVATFLDAFADARAASGRPVTTIAWAQWAFDDWHEQQAGTPAMRDGFARHRREAGVRAQEGVAAARAVLAAGLPRAVVSAVDLRSVLAGGAALDAHAVAESLRGLATAASSWDPADTWPDDEVAQSVARVWHDVLGRDGFAADDDFFELGGNSLFAIQIIARLRELHGDLPMNVIFEAATVPGVAAAIRQQQAAGLGLDEFEALLREVEGLSAEETADRLGENDV